MATEGDCWAKIAQWESAKHEARYAIQLKKEKIVYFLVAEGILVASVSMEPETKDFRWKRLFHFTELDTKTEAVVGPVETGLATLFRPTSRVVGERFLFNRGSSKEAFVLKYPPDGSHQTLLSAIEFADKIKRRISAAALVTAG